MMVISYMVLDQIYILVKYTLYIVGWTCENGTPFRDDQMCDGHVDCPNCLCDEKHCNDGTLTQCNDGSYISLDMVCDGKIDCDCECDEKNCSGV